MIKKSILLFALTLAILLTACTKEPPKVLIIGDSISIGYTKYVKEHFADKAIIVHNEGNAQHTKTGLEKINTWIADENWDIIQFNWGLWDLCYKNPESENPGHRDKINGKIYVPIEQYEANLDSLVGILEKTGAKLIFVTTSYVPEDEHGRFTEDATKYNNVAKKIMEKHSIIVNDIYESSIPIHKEYGLGSDNVHYTKEGYKELSKLISDFLSKEM